MPSTSTANSTRTPLTNLPSWTGALVALLLLMAVTVAIEYARSGTTAFISPENLINILRQWSFVGIIAIGMTFVIITGGIDLSVGSLLAFVGGLGILTLNALLANDVSEWLAVVVAGVVIIGSGTLAGLLNGLLIAKGRLAPFIATLGGLAAYRALAQTLADGGEFRSQSFNLFPLLGSGGIPVPFTNVAPNAPLPVPLTIPWPVVIFLIMAAAASIVLNRTRFGRYALATGSNERAAVYSAINVDRIKLATYSLVGACTGVAALLLASRMNSISSGQTGGLTELDAIAAVVIGGTRMSGGSGSIGGTVLGVLILGVAGNMLNMLGVNPYLQGLVKGLIIIAAVLVQRRKIS